LRSGDVVGTLPDIRQRYGLGRWACREAIGILEMRGWLESRRGAGGGLVLTLPTSRDVVKLMLLHLCLKGMCVDKVIEARVAVHRSVLRKLMALGSKRPAIDKPHGSQAPTFDVENNSKAPSFSRWLAAQTGSGALSFLMEFATSLYDECVGATSIERTIEKEESLLDAIRSKDERLAHTALDDYLACTERLNRGEAVRLPQVFVRDGHGNGVTHAARLAQHLLDEIAQQAHCGQTDLGTEAQIGEHYRLNRDIVRRAIRTLEDIGVVVPRRGRDGGLTRREPELAAVVELFPPLLFQRRVSADEVAEAMFFLKFETARLAAVRMHNGLASSKTVAAAKELLCTVPLRPHELIVMENRVTDLAENDVLSACDRGMLFYGPVMPPEQTDPCGPLASKAIASTLAVIAAIQAGDVQRTEAAFIKRQFDFFADLPPSSDWTMRASAG